MSFAINTNTAAMNVLFNLNISQNQMNQSSEQLSSGYKINSAADNAAGLAIATRMTNQIEGLNQGTQNAQDGLSMLQTMEGGVSSIENMLGRMRDLALQAANGTQTGADRTQIKQELSQLKSEITRTAQTTQFNNLTLLTGIANGSSLTFQVGSNANGQQTISLQVSGSIGNLTASASAINITSSFTNLAMSSTTGATAASALVTTIDKAISNVSKFRANIGAVEDRLNFAITNLQSESNNLSAAKSRIMDTNMAQTMTNFTKNQILVNAGISMLAQANQQPSSVLKLLG